MSSPEMLHFLNSPATIAGAGVSDHALFTSIQQPEQQFSGFMGDVPGFDNLLNHVIKPDPDFPTGWTDFSDQSGHGSQNVVGFHHMHQNTLLKMTSCSATMADYNVQEEGNSGSVSLSPKKRKVDKNPSLKVASEEEDTREKRIKVCGVGEDCKINHDNNIATNIKCNNSGNTSSKEKSKVSEVQKLDYIHVRARRGQATDSHSLAERARREKISERMKCLQDLVPGCNKIMGKAGMLDEIINYVQSLQRQVEFLSMKLATVDPRLDFNIDNLLTKQKMFTVSGFPARGCCSETANPAYFPLNSLEQVVSCYGLEMGINPTDMALRTISAPINDSSCFNLIQPTYTWDADLQKLYRMEFQQGTKPFQSPHFTGSDEENNLKMEM